MALQYSGTLRDNQLNQVETTLSTTPRLRIYTGTPPANCATAASGTLLVDLPLPSDWMGAASGGSKAIANGPWSATGTVVPGTGTAGYFRLWDSTVTTCHMQGTVATTAADMIIDNTSISAGQTVNVTTFTLSAGNA